MKWTWSPSQRLITQGPRAKAHPTPRERERQTSSSLKRRRKGEEYVEDVEEAPGKRCQKGMDADPQGGKTPGKRSPGEARPQGDEAPRWRCRQGISGEADFFDYCRYLMPTVTGVFDGTQNQRANRIIDFFQFLNLWLIMSYFTAGQWKTDKDKRMSGQMTIIPFPVLH